MKKFMQVIREFRESWFNARGGVVLGGLAIGVVALSVIASNALFGVFLLFAASGTTAAGFALQGVALASANPLSPHQSEYTNKWPFDGTSGHFTSPRPTSNPTVQLRFGQLGAIIAAVGLVSIMTSPLGVVVAFLGSAMWAAGSATHRIVRRGGYPTYWPFQRRSTRLVYNKKTETYSLTTDEGQLTLAD